MTPRRRRARRGGARGRRARGRARPRRRSSPRSRGRARRGGDRRRRGRGRARRGGRRRGGRRRGARRGGRRRRFRRRRRPPDDRLALPRPIAVAITGGIGAGKSTALAAFRAHGAATVSSDEIVHHLLRTDLDVRAALVERFGDGILGEDGAPDRGRIAAIVFDDAEALAFLEALLHPLVSREYLRWREQLAALDDPPRGLRDRGAAALRVGRRDALRPRRRDHRAAPAPGAAAAGAARQPRRRGCSTTPRRSRGPTSTTSTPGPSRISTRGSQASWRS